MKVREEGRDVGDEHTPPPLIIVQVYQEHSLHPTDTISAVLSVTVDALAAYFNIAAFLH